ncbi:hypothetical protein RhiirB3_447719, partial [Rhizophagus irregularis]
FSLKHIISFYELIEEQVANSIIDKIDEKFKTPLTQQMKDSIKNIIDYDDSENQNQQRIPAKAFAFALKRFIYRFLLVDFNIENLNLNTYFLDFTLNLWSDVNEESVEKLFPTCLLVSHAYNSYNFIVEEIEKTMNERQNSRREVQKNQEKESPIDLPVLPPDNDVKAVHVRDIFLYDIPKRWNEVQVEDMVKKISDKSQKDLEDTLSNAAEKGDGTKWTFCTFREVKDQVDQRAERTEDRRYSNVGSQGRHEWGLEKEMNMSKEPEETDDTKKKEECIERLVNKEMVTEEDMVDFINEYRELQYKGMEVGESDHASLGDKRNCGDKDGFTVQAV